MIAEDVPVPPLVTGLMAIPSTRGWAPLFATRSLPVFGMALFGADVAAICLSLICSVLLCQVIAGPAWDMWGVASTAVLLRQTLAAFGVSVAITFVSLAARGHYLRRIPHWSALQGIVVTCIVAMISNGFFNFLLGVSGNRRFLMLTWLLLPPAMLACRKIMRLQLAHAGLWQIRTILIGEGETLRETQEALHSEPDLGYEVVDTLDPATLPLDRTGQIWRSLLLKHRSKLLVIAGDARTAIGRATLESVVRSRVPFAIVPPLGGMPVLGFEATRFFSHDTLMFSYRNNLMQPVARLTKMAFDLVVALAGLLVLLPLFLVLVCLVKRDGGPAFYTHQRVGAGGRMFNCLKFRSMVTNGDEVLRQLLATDAKAAAEWAATNKLAHDPRVTWIGRLLRKTSLDELPQLLNVLRLEMSLVGPRPIVPAEVPRYGDDIAYYYETRPGLTGLWQVSGRSSTTYEKRVQLDTWYVKNWTVWHDLAIIAKTVPALLARRGAC